MGSSCIRCLFSCCGGSSRASIPAVGSQVDLTRPGTATGNYPQLAHMGGGRVRRIKQNSWCSNLETKLKQMTSGHDGEDKLFKGIVNTTQLLSAALVQAGGATETITKIDNINKAVRLTRDGKAWWNLERGCARLAWNAAVNCSLIIRSFFQDLTTAQWKQILITEGDRTAIGDGKAAYTEAEAQAIAQAEEETLQRRGGGVFKTCDKIFLFVREFFKMIGQAAFTVCFVLCAPITYWDTMIEKVSEETRKIGHLFGVFWATYHAGEFLSTTSDLVVNHQRLDFEEIALNAAKLGENGSALVNDTIKLSGLKVHPLVMPIFGFIEAMIGLLRTWYTRKT